MIESVCVNRSSQKIVALIGNCVNALTWSKLTALIRKRMFLKISITSDFSAFRTEDSIFYCRTCTFLQSSKKKELQHEIFWHQPITIKGILDYLLAVLDCKAPVCARPAVSGSVYS